MTEHGLDNLALATGIEDVDHLNAEFYARFPYPWQAHTFQRWSDPSVETAFLNQAVGEWKGFRVPEEARIWVAGCGTNQALITALRFPAARVVGSDLSTPSLEICDANARRLGVSNLELREESINGVAYREEFDYVVCTGVIHHNSEPGHSLRIVAASLRPRGVLELMVYNTYHWLLPAAAEKAIRTLAGPGAGLDRRLAVARRLVDSFPERGLMGDFLATYRSAGDEVVADALAQPVAHSYTLDGLLELIGGAGLEILQPAISLFERSSTSIFWDLETGDPRLDQAFEQLSDLERWRVVNCLLLERSPMLWFYLQRLGNPPRRDSGELRRDFLAARLEPNRARRQVLVRRRDGTFSKLPPAPLPAPADPELRRIVEAADGDRTMRQVLDEAAVTADPSRIRMQLATPAFPYLRRASGRR